MKIASDMRIPVLLGALQAETDDVVLAEGDANAPISGYTERFTLPPAKFGHITGCNCCTPRGPAADALARLFRARATGAVPFFKRVIVRASPAGEAAIRDAIGSDVVTAARYCLAGGEARGSRTTVSRAKAILKRVGTAGAVRKDDQFDVD